MKRVSAIYILLTLFSHMGILAQDINDLRLIPLDSINTDTDDSSPIVDLKSKRLFYSKKNSLGDKDLAIADWNGSTWVENSRTISLNNKYDNEVFHIDSQGTVFFQKAVLDPAGRAIFGIFSSVLNQNQWSEPIKQNIKYFNNKSEDQSFCVNKNADVIIFSMQSYFSYGVEDLYVSFKKTDNNWTEPKNLGNTINTAFEEFTPFLDDDDRTLFFSSNGHKGGYGSKDIWVSYRLDSTWTKWTEPLNLGPKVNTIGMEMSFRKTGIHQIPYLVVTSRTSDGQSDIFGLKLDEISLDSMIASIKPLNEEVLLENKKNQAVPDLDTANSTVMIDSSSIIDSAHAQILDSTNNILVMRALSKVTNLSIPSTFIYKSRNKSDSLFLARDSSLRVTFDWLDTVEIVVNSPSFLPQTKTVIFENRHFGIELREDIFLDSLEIGKSIQFEHVLFKRGTPELIETSSSDLDYVAQILKENQDLKIQIAGHTDNSGNAYLNLLLSEKRANTIKKYLVEKGINPSRIETKGYGGSSPIASNDNEETMKLNRRVEFKLLKQD